MRGISSAVGILIVTLVGMGVGPTLVGFLSQDMLGDPSKIGVALSVVSTAALIVSSALALVAIFNYKLELDNTAARAA